jgi:hypothetical protein
LRARKTPKDFEKLPDIQRKTPTKAFFLLINMAEVVSHGRGGMFFILFFFIPNHS